MLLRPKALIIYSRDHYKVEICLFNEKNETQEIRMVFCSLTDGLPKGMSFSLICIGLKLRKQVKILVHCAHN